MDNKTLKRQTIHYRIRKKVSGTASIPRLHVFRSNKAIYCQVIDDVNGVTLIGASSKEVSSKDNKSAVAKSVGMIIAEKAKSLGIASVKFDRGGYLYHGRIKSLADGAREGGLNF